MNNGFDQIMRRLDMMTARGVLRAVIDDGGIQLLQAGVLHGETIDGIERFQSYGVSSVPPPGGDVAVIFLQGNRDQPVAVAVNDRASRPKGLKGGEVVLYNDKQCTVLLDADGKIAVTAEEDISVKGKNVTVEATETVTVTAAQAVLVESGTRIDLNAPDGVFANGRLVQTL
jgi:phage baseplate assembly protein V